MAGGGPGDGRGFDDVGDPFDDDAFDDALAALAHWAGEIRVDDAVGRRRRAKWLGRQSEHQASLLGVLGALAERSRPVLVAMANGRRHRGVVTLLAPDMVGLVTAQGELWLAMRAVASVRTQPGEAAASGPATDRPTPSRVRRADLGSQLDRLAGVRTRLSVRTERADDAVTGVLMAMGQDVLTVRDDGGGLVYVALASVTEVSLAESG